MANTLKESKTSELVVFESVNKEEVKAKIYVVRGHRVMLDSDIAMYFGVTTGNLNKAKNRNLERFPQHFAFVLSDEEVSLFQSGISMQTKGVRGGRAYNPTVYTEQGVAMLTSVLHTPQAISASVQIMEAFVEMSHYMLQNRQLLPQDALNILETRQSQLSDRVQSIENNMLTKADLSHLMQLFDSGVQTEEILILNGEPFKADVAYQKIYRRSKKSIIVIDDYLGVKTLHHLVHVAKNVDITIISDNKGGRPLRQAEYDDYLIEYPERNIQFIRADNKAHDRYIVLDYNTKQMKIYHCGASSKDAGKRITTITEIKETGIYKEIIKSFLSGMPLQLR